MGNRKKIVSHLAENADSKEVYTCLSHFTISRSGVSADLPDYIMKKDIVRAALRVAKEVDATDDEWREFMEKISKSRQK